MCEGGGGEIGWVQSLLDNLYGLLQRCIQLNACECLWSCRLLYVFKNINILISHHIYQSMTKRAKVLGEMCPRCTRFIIFFSKLKYFNNVNKGETRSVSYSMYRSFHLFWYSLPFVLTYFQKEKEGMPIFALICI